MKNLLRFCLRFSISNPILLTAFLIAILLLYIHPIQAQATSPLEGLDTYIEQAMKDWGVPGLAIAVVEGDSVAYAKGFGTRTIYKNEPVDEHTLFAIGSNTKAMTVTALGMLAHEGKLSWDDKVIDHLPDFHLSDPYMTHNMTLRDLASHRSGFTRGDLVWYGSGYDRTEIINRLQHFEPTLGFRNRYHYQNIMFLVAGQVVTAVSGTSWDNYLTDHLFKPLRMTRSNTTVSVLSGMDNVATPHAKEKDKIITISYRNIDNIAPAGSVNSSALEMAQWLRLQLGHGKFEGTQLVDSATITEMRTPVTPIRLSADSRRLFPSTHFSAYGMGWGLRDYHGRLIVSHGGGIDGNLSRFGYVPEENFGVVVLTNITDHNLHSALFWRVMDLYLTDDPKDWSQIFQQEQENAESKSKEAEEKRKSERIKRTKPSLSLKSYAGTYRSDFYGDLIIAHEERKLTIALGPEFQGDLEHWHYDTFKINWSSLALADEFTLITFTLGADGKVKDTSIDLFDQPAFRRVENDE